jgi:DNA polymerase III sliding clamp (beta) subunit (PCNA family)
MKTDKRYEIERACGTDITQKRLANVHFDAVAKVLVATNGHWLAKVPCEVDADHDASGFISPDAFKAARKASKRSNDMLIGANGALVIQDATTLQTVATLPRPTVDACGEFPPYEQVIPAYKAGDEGTITIGLNAAYLLDLVRAIGSEKKLAEITIKLPEKDDAGKFKAMLDPVVVNGSVAGGVGVLMPFRI